MKSPTRLSHSRPRTCRQLSSHVSTACAPSTAYLANPSGTCLKSSLIPVDRDRRMACAQVVNANLHNVERPPSQTKKRVLFNTVDNPIHTFFSSSVKTQSFPSEDKWQVSGVLKVKQTCPRPSFDLGLLSG